MHTRADLVTEALKILGFLPEGVTPSAEDYALVDSRIDGMIEELQEREVVYISDPGTLADHNSAQFEDKHFGSLASILANAVKARYGAAGDTMLQAEAMKAESDLYTIEAQPYTRKIAEGQYF